MALNPEQIDRENKESLDNLDRIVNKIVQELPAKAIGEISKDVYAKIQQKWPEDTVWSNANHRISLSASRDMPLIPPERPTKKGALTNERDALRESVFKQLDNLPRGTEAITIGNAVPYAADVKNITNNGRRIYIDSVMALDGEGAIRKALEKLDLCK